MKNEQPRWTEEMEKWIRHCVDHDLRKLKTREYLTSHMHSQGILCQWKGNDTFEVLDDRYQYELQFTKGGICRGYRAKNLNLPTDLDYDTYKGYVD